MRGIVIINGYRRSLAPADIENRVSALSRTADLKIFTTEFSGHARHIAARAASSGVDVVVAVGGDGTVNEVINGVAGTQTAVAVLPAGTANDFARQMRITGDAMLAISDLAACKFRPVDLIRVNDWYFATIGGLGLPCEALERAERLKRDPTIVGRSIRSLGSYAYLLALVSLGGTLTHPRGKVTVDSGHGCFDCEPLSLLVANQSKVGGSFTVAPGAVNNDGLCELQIVERTNHLLPAVHAAAQTLWPVLREPESVIRLQSSRVVILCEKSTRFFGDGEIRLEGHTFDIDVVPGNLHVLVPPVPATSSVHPSRHCSDPRVRTARPSLRPLSMHRAKGSLYTWKASANGYE